ncbi:hypothetical protein D8B26_007849 [Coccidioides posadasii str. Silveira]|uniref:Uncharacterized protein n=1 Tax=Coccidioides posadasii (strain RMSCC 757 / Silveira) TaxID=443226 RepID=E9D1H1_COCPS|nr:conserved hypothetical protein [Coccidioides posadasii str. Silveira]QVM13235.1 hypothetical protein D8B26_007849 [Coccidioides posadasii str. Silveira]
MGPRRSHRKSRLGCLQCKRRKIKCDEAPPPCGNCKKHNIECQFAAVPVKSSSAAKHGPLSQARPVLPPPGALIATAGRVNPVNNLHTGATPAYLPPTPPNAFNTTPSGADQLDIFSSFVGPTTDLTSDLHLHDLELLHHYTTQTYRTLSYNNEHKEIWKNYIPKEALSHPFLMHGLLAIAALHLFEYCAEESDDRRKYLELATRHQNLALSSFRPQLSNITPSNCQAVFAFSSLIAALAFAFSKSAGNIRAGEPVEQVLQDFFLFRGVEGVLTAFWDIIRKGKLGPLVHRPSDPTCSQPISRDVINALDYLHDCNGENVTQISAEEKAAYNHAIRELRISFERSPSSWETVFRWPIVLPEAYLTHLENRRPMALVILAHYCVILGRLDACWWSQGWSGHLFEAIYRSLNVSWRPLLQWPMQMIGLTERLANIP